jgi:aldose 1-epimerase
MEIVSLVVGDARADVAPAVGGAVTSFSWRGRDVLRPTPAAAIAEGNVRLCASFPLVPFSNRIADASLRFGGQRYALHRNYADHPNAIHGVGFQRPWSVVEAHADRVVLALDYAPDRDPVHAWPFAFRALQRLEVAGRQDVAALQMTLTIESRDTREFPFGLGWHPYFPRGAATVLGFRADGMWQTGPTLLPTQRVAVPRELAFDPPRRIGETTLDNVFTGFEGTARLEDPDRGLRIAIEADGAAPFVVVYVPAGRDFLAVEPVTHMTDAFNRHADGESGTGTRTLAAGAAFSCTMRIVAQAAEGTTA